MNTEIKENTNKQSIEKNSLFKEALFQLKGNKSAIIGFIIIVGFILMAVLAPWLTPFEPNSQEISIRKTAPFVSSHILGTDDLGRDLLTRIIYGSRVSLIIGTISVGISLTFGILIGLISGYYGGWVDRIVMRFIDIMLAIPYVLLTIVIVALLGPSLVNAMIAIGVSQIPQYARVVRASVLAERENDYITAERSLGASNSELMFKSILPNSIAPIFVQATLGVGNAILSSAALSFLGLGAQPPTSEWGLMIASSREFVTSAWWIVTFPGVAVLLTVLGFNLLADGLRDVLDPRMKD
ncbi:MAG: ABC transporter permease [Spirochaetia bacterium]|jgi:ABC-type dipeptide/oligopeptide/nickel transport system permease subunit|nr:ABC transporter permease [Spirochaetia bacterium]